MNALRLLGVLPVLLVSGIPAQEHRHEAVAGSPAGKVLEIPGGHAEFFVQADRTVRVAFYDRAMKSVPPAAHEVRAVAETKPAKAVLEFKKTGEAFVSTSALPEGDGYRIVLQIRSAPEVPPRNFRITYLAHTCGGCDRAEYACTCGH